MDQWSKALQGGETVNKVRLAMPQAAFLSDPRLDPQLLTTTTRKPRVAANVHSNLPTQPLQLLRLHLASPLPYPLPSAIP